jgi:hypothetical protein
MRKICRGRPLGRQVFSAENVYYSSVTHRPTHFSFSSPLQLLKYLDVFLEKEFDMEALTFYTNEGLERDRHFEGPTREGQAGFVKTKIVCCITRTSAMRTDQLLPHD